MKNTKNILNTTLYTIRTKISSRQEAAVAPDFHQDDIAAQVLPAGNEFLAVDEKKVMNKRNAKQERKIQEGGIKVILNQESQTECKGFQTCHQETYTQKIMIAASCTALSMRRSLKAGDSTNNKTGYKGGFSLFRRNILAGVFSGLSVLSHIAEAEEADQQDKQ